ncbi:hypothetical protein RhiirA4_471075 [Rhizophagus irregularis]|uniref:Uncharacterized protein n=1 Tax=Rhizophagus irregularis TaxID=588596 RepID=A0A2I1H2F5_9GLOM|nr:hypothetical protein RhiirA4_471075 [Rhizophagus irregularis]
MSNSPSETNADSGFTGSDFIWPYELNTYEHREVFDYIVDPINGKELATNTIEYRLLESGDLDESKGTHVLLVHGKVIRYGDKISSEEHKELQKNFQDASTHLLLNVLLSYADSQLLMIMKGKSGRFSHIILRNVDNPSDVVTMANTELNF